MDVGGGPEFPIPTAGDVGRDRMLPRGRAASLECSDGQAWVTISRFRTVREANAALDEAIAPGASPDDLRVTEAGPSPVMRVGVILVLVGLAFALGFMLYVLLGA